jgi:uncharacterized protein YdeI (YjbR/CyaY-like superfamily)
MPKQLPKRAAKTTPLKRVSKRAAPPGIGAAEQSIKSFATKQALVAWLDAHHGASPGVWLRIMKVGERTKSVTYPEAIDAALCYGWIDGQRKSHDAASYLQKFTPRGSRSIWSKINCEKARVLIERGEMQAAGLAEIERAKRDGRWDAAYAGPRTIGVPEDLRAALDRSAKAAAFFATLNSQNRYAILFRMHTAKKAETRARRLEQFVRMLERGETIYPQKASPGK